MNPYIVLGISQTASHAGIRDAYRAKAKLFHPDVSTLKDAPERFIQITQAYDLLCDPVKRARFDQLLNAPQGRSHTVYTQNRHEQDIRSGRAQAEKRAATYSQMGYERFDKEFFADTAGYFVPKMMGCFGIFIAAAIAFGLSTLLIIELGLPKVLIAIPLFTVIPVGAWLSTGFDAWHERKRKRR